MSMLTRCATAIVATLLLPAAAFAQIFEIRYTTDVDSTSGPAQAVLARVTTDGGAFYGPGTYLITGISGTRGATAISGLSDPLSSLFFPAQQPFGYSFPTFVDTFGFTFTAGGVDFQVYRDPGDTFFYHEFAGNGTADAVGRLIAPANFAIREVPEPAAWAMMLAGFAAAGVTLRRRRPAAPSLA